MTVTIVVEDHDTTVDFVEAVDAVRADLSVSEIRLVEGGRLRRVWRRDASAPSGWTVERHE